MPVSLTQEGFLQRAHKTHGDLYDYTHTVYIKGNTKVNITCKKHGVFTQTPENHFNGNGCPACGMEQRIKKLSFSKEEFISRAKELHSNTYDYSKVNYSNNKTKVEIVCKKHGAFMQTPDNHLQGHSCPKCGTLQAAKKIASTKEEFIQRVKEVHGDKYDYSKVNYISNKSKVEIICKEHGTFMQTPHSHLQGRNCPVCSPRGFNKDKPAILYYLRVCGGTAYKIGITTQSVEERYSPEELEDITILQRWHYSDGEEALKQEQKILKEYSYAKYTGDKLLVTGNTELFDRDVLLLDT